MKRLPDIKIPFMDRPPTFLAFPVGRRHRRQVMATTGRRRALPVGTGLTAQHAGLYNPEVAVDIGAIDFQLLQP